jgi:hypothetical protein
MMSVVIQLAFPEDPPARRQINTVSDHRDDPQLTMDHCLL